MGVQKNYIGGEWVDGAAERNNINPSDLSDVVSTYAQADAAAVTRAVDAARAAAPGWNRSTPQQRYDALEFVGNEIMARREELGRLLSREEGKTLPEGIGEATRAAQIFKFFAGEALRIQGEKLQSVRPGIDVEITREPVGIVRYRSPACRRRLQRHATRAAAAARSP